MIGRFSDRWIPIAALLLAIGCRRTEVAEAPPEDEVWLSNEQMEKSSVRLAQAKEQDLPQFVHAGGRIAFDDLQVSHVLSPVTGRISRVIAARGERVKKGAPLLAIISPDVGTAFADLVKAQADLIAAEHEFHRQEQLAEVHAGSRRDFETAEDNYRKARAEMERARQKASLLKSGSVDRVTQEYMLRSPIDGVVVDRFANLGLEVQGQYSGGTSVELVTIGAIDHVWVFADIPASELARVKEGSTVLLKVLAYPSRSFEGKVEWISTTLDPAMRTAKIRCALPNPDHALKPEMFGTVLISTDSKRAVALSADAVVPINEQSFLFVHVGQKADGRQIFKRRRVRIGEQVPGGLVAILEGLSSGEKVVVKGSITREQPNDEVWLTDEQLQSARIRVEAPSYGPLETHIAAGGRLTFSDLLVTHVFSPVTGRVTQVLAQPGQCVKKGDPLLKLLSPDVGTAFADRLKAQADVIASEHEFNRQKELYALNAGARRDLEMAQDNYGKAKAELERALQKTRLFGSGTVDRVTQEYTLRSPIEGEVVARTVNPGLEVQGQYSGASTSPELFTIGNTSELWLFGDIYEADLHNVEAGAPVRVTVDGYPGKTFEGKVDWVSDTLDPLQHTARVRCVLSNPDQLLRPEMYEAINISGPRREGLSLPRPAVLRLGNDTYVLVESGKKPDGRRVFKRRRVVVNEESSGNPIPILDGLTAADKVVVENAIFLTAFL